MTEPEKILLEALKLISHSEELRYQPDETFYSEDALLAQDALAAYEKAKALTWDEFVKIAPTVRHDIHTVVCEIGDSSQFRFDKLIFTENGEIHLVNFGRIWGNRTPAQMLAILTALTEDGK